MVNDTPKNNSQKRRLSTAAITFRVPKWWIKKLDRIAREFALRNQENISKTDLIRDAIEKVYIEEIKRTLTSLEYEAKRETDLLKSLKIF